MIALLLKHHITGSWIQKHKGLRVWSLLCWCSLSQDSAGADLIPFSERTQASEDHSSNNRHSQIGKTNRGSDPSSTSMWMQNGQGNATAPRDRCVGKLYGRRAHPHPGFIEWLTHGHWWILDHRYGKSNVESFTFCHRLLMIIKLISCRWEIYLIINHPKLS